MSLSNEVLIVGNVGSKPELRGRTKTGVAITAFAVAQNVNGMDLSTQKLVKKDPQWFQISCFADLAIRALTCLNKGDLVLIAGGLKAHSYQVASGEKRHSVEIVAREIFRVERLRRAQAENESPTDVPASPSDFASFEMDGEA